MKRKLIRIGLFVVGGVAVIALCVLAFIQLGLPNVGPAPELKVEGTKAQIERGRYLANNVAVCMDCHSTRDWSKFSGPLTPGTLGRGGDKFGHEIGLPGEIYAKNITPAAIGNWTDGELYRAITTGVDRNGEPLFPIMPYHSFGKMDTEDVKSIIAYLRTIPAVEAAHPKRQLDFPLNVIVRTMPAAAEPVTRPDTTDQLAYGKYLVLAASCQDCHTASEDKALAGGREFKIPAGTLQTANLTPDKETGLGNWTEEQFLQRFKAYNDPQNIPVTGMKDYNSIMPWTMYAGMKDSDLKAIYAYLRSVKPMRNQVVKFKPASDSGVQVAQK
ncbi:hypothetical protein GCM10023189_07650 [Nibrella saemangeumensis]|uniref:Cytochrome c domain-containing protein n=1 Tax=Nibrella saemangeumensis TaxID=1084526 RepID=A0ABP8MHB4_9BACT